MPTNISKNQDLQTSCIPHNLIGASTATDIYILQHKITTFASAILKTKFIATMFKSFFKKNCNPAHNLFVMFPRKAHHKELNKQYTCCDAP